ncbi:PA domain-containing protein [Gottfriedia sp. NPDC057991]|uniref:PA domain-containing protein n=1 Tax=Gottfriedia sp. NPDC057991 TaxID=3346298 RepID=UPI0036D9554C
MLTTADFNGKDLNGNIAFIKRGTNALIDKIKNAKTRGAIGVIIMISGHTKESGES